MPTSRSPPGPARSSARTSREGRIGQVDPADDAGERRRRWRRGRGAPASRPARSGPGPRPCRPRRPRRARAAVVERERAANRRVDLGGHPRVRRPVRIEEVLVCVDDPGHRGTGASAGMRPSCPQLVPEGRRDRAPHGRRVVVEVGGRPDARDQPRDRRMGERELDRGGAERDLVALADRARSGAPDRRPGRAPAGSRNARPAAGSARTPLFMTPTDHDRDAPLQAQRAAGPAAPSWSSRV